MNYKIAMIALVWSTAAALGALQPITIDGQFDDWTAADIVAVDPAGDADGIFDLTRLYARSNGPLVFLRFDTGIVRNLQSGSREEGTLVFRFTNLRTNQELLIDTRGRSVSHRNEAGELSEVGWYSANYRSGPTYAHHEFELQADLSVLGTLSGDSIRLAVSGSDAFDEPIELAISDPVDTSSPVSIDMSRADTTILRAASLNTLRNGIVDGSRSGALLRLLGSAKPDVVLLQEEYNTSAEDVQTRLESGLGGKWNVAKVRDTVVASRYPVRKLQSLDDSYTAAIVETPTHGPALVFSVHPKCCGTIGSEEDERRIHQTRAMIETIRIARSRFGTDIPILLAGDWNMVGSRSPLDLLTDPTGPSMHHIDARHQGSREVYTWFAPDSAFAPGVLDLAAVDALSASASAGFLLDTRTVRPEDLRKHGLHADDSAATDHLLMVIDLGRDAVE